MGPDAGHPWRPHALGAEDCDRLEEIGDLHAQASTYTTALEYYRRLLDDETLRRLSPERRVALLR